MKPEGQKVERDAINPGWDNIRRINEVRMAKKVKRFKKEELYRHMVGSVRSLRRRLKELRA